MTIRHVGPKRQMRRRPSARTCHVAGTNLSTTEWKRLVEKQQLLDKRVSSTVAMLAYGTALGAAARVGRGREGRDGRGSSFGRWAWES